MGDAEENSKKPQKRILFLCPMKVYTPHENAVPAVPAKNVCDSSTLAVKVANICGPDCGPASSVFVRCVIFDPDTYNVWSTTPTP